MPTAQPQSAKGSNRTRSAKRATNLSLSADVLDAAKSLPLMATQIPPLMATSNSPTLSAA